MTYTLRCEYIASYVWVNKGCGKPVDRWALSILTYDMVAGQAPSLDEGAMGIRLNDGSCSTRATTSLLIGGR